MEKWKNDETMKNLNNKKSFKWNQQNSNVACCDYYTFDDNVVVWWHLEQLHVVIVLRGKKEKLR